MEAVTLILKELISEELVKLVPAVQLVPLVEYSTEVTLVPLAEVVMVAVLLFLAVPRRIASQLPPELLVTFTETSTFAVQIAQLASLHATDFTYPQFAQM